MQISSGSTTGRTSTRVTVEVLPSAAGQPTEIRVLSDSDSGAPAILGATIGGASVKNVPVDTQHPFDWNVVASAPIGTTPVGCGPHPPADMPGCNRRQDAQVTAQPAGASAPAVTATPAAEPPRTEVAGQQAAPTQSATAVARAVSSPPQPGAGQSPAAPQTPSTPQAPSMDVGNVSTPLTYTVQPGDTLRGVAMRFYGDPNAFDRIARANASRVMPDGLILVDPGVIRPGWELIIPEPTRAVIDRDGAHWYTVQPGDTLVGIAARLLGDGQRWPEVYALNQATQPGGNSTLAAGPSLIRPGMQLLLPGRASNIVSNTSAQNAETGV
ncbi:MAG: LysM peptidoglycan-binding domain-containing protein [Chloroflexota bacterium]|nr:LysM peptidoglycan-binding domain-containing protein [Chloroflexota bacterium]